MTTDTHDIFVSETVETTRPTTPWADSGKLEGEMAERKTEPICMVCGQQLRAGCDCQETPLDSAPAWSQPPQVGSVLGSYRLLDILGEGGMGRVYLAEHERLERKVAIKVLLPALTVDGELTQRFFDEAKAVNRIRHENIIDVTDFFDDGALTYYVMEYLEGDNLEDVLRTERRLPMDRAVRIGLQIARAMQSAHEAGIVHRDLKPANIFLRRHADGEEVAKVLDFGVAKLLHHTGHRETTGVRSLFGSPGYIAPEYATGSPADSRSDIYSLGVMLFEMVTGQQLFFSMKPREMLIMHIQKAPRSPRSLAPENVSTELDTLILQCLQKEPAMRPAGMGKVVEKLKTIVRRSEQSQASKEHAQTLFEVAQTDLEIPAIKKRASYRRYALGVVVAIVAGLIWYASGERTSEVPAPTAELPSTTLSLDPPKTPSDQVPPPTISVQSVVPPKSPPAKSPAKKRVKPRKKKPAQEVNENDLDVLVDPFGGTE